MNNHDISNAIFTKDTREVERAYRALVGYPNEENVEASSGAYLVAQLDNVTAYLANDTSVMPSDTCDAADLPAGSTYADARADFLAHRDSWHRHFVAKVGTGV